MQFIRRSRIDDILRLSCPAEFVDDLAVYRNNPRDFVPFLYSLVRDGDIQALIAVVDGGEFKALGMIPSKRCCEGEGLKSCIAKAQEFLSELEGPLVAGVALDRYPKRARFLKFLGFREDRVDKNFLNSGEANVVFVRE